MWVDLENSMLSGTQYNIHILIHMYQLSRDERLAKDKRILSHGAEEVRALVRRTAQLTRYAALPPGRL